MTPTERLQALAESSHLFSEATVDFRRLLETVGDRFGSLVGDACYVRLLAEDGMTLVPVVTYHADPQMRRYLRETNDRIPLRVGEGIAGKVVATGQAAFFPDVPPEFFRDRVKPEYVPSFERLAISAMIAVPLRSRGVVIGFVAVIRTGPDRPAYTPQDLQLVQDLAERAALAIDNGRLVEVLERRVDQRTRTLETANRELEAFAFSVSHDLRGPLRAIDGYSRALEEDYRQKLPDEACRILDRLRVHARRINRLIEDLLQLSRIGHRGIEPVTTVDMRALVHAAVDSVRGARKLDVRMEALPLARGNLDLLAKVWMHLVDNAIKFSPRREPIKIEIDAVAGDDEVSYRVRDHGIGFDPKAADKLFVMFERAHDKVELAGNGIGLALVKRIIEAHGGRVTAEGRPNEGATFSFTLPGRPIGH